MTKIHSNIKRLLAFFVLATVSSIAFARYNDCSAPMPMTINIPAVSIPDSLPLGQSIPGAQATFLIPINCTVNPGGDWYMTLPSGTFSLVPGYSDVYTVAGMAAGVGFRMRNAAGAVMVPINYTGLNTFDFGLARMGANSMQGTFELVKTGTAAVGSFGFMTEVHVPNQEWANGGAQSSSLVSFNYTVLANSVPTCTVTTPNVAVSLPAVSRTAFNGVGATAGTTPFGIALNCANNAKPSISLTDAATPSNQSNALTLSSGSTATGIGVQLLYQMQPLPFGPATYSYTNGNPAVTNLTFLGTQSGATNIGFMARYVQTASSVNSGSVSAAATFTLVYN
jgi:type 1 fimbria pilin